ncbi:hypothetical protein DEO72_LG1g3015 [Vigna unguiculata]|uniref:Secreted protein n=1 Tax=Vigna unguiculata TaxID=3917 RepID=A0A4D6KMQ6_VIGUN|nr:hypothetical protein DEO72_LG1g3015 [Vigna unguiculata]
MVVAMEKIMHPLLQLLFLRPTWCVVNAEGEVRNTDAWRCCCNNGDCWSVRLQEWCGDAVLSVQVVFMVANGVRHTGSHWLRQKMGRCFLANLMHVVSHSDAGVSHGGDSASKVTNVGNG